MYRSRDCTLATYCSSKCVYFLRLYIPRTDCTCQTCSITAVRRCAYLVHGPTAVGGLLHHRLLLCCAAVSTWFAVSSEDVHRQHIAGWSLYTSTCCYETKPHQLPIPGIGLCYVGVLHNRRFHGVCATFFNPSLPARRKLPVLLT